MKGQALLLATLCLAPVECFGQVSYVARFTLEKQTALAGEPVFCDFTIQNTGPRAFAFSLRPPRRVVGHELEQEPHFVVTAARGTAAPDPAARRCAGEPGGVVYGYVTLPPGQTHLERWLVNQWAGMSQPGHYRLRAERRLPLYGLEAGAPGSGTQPVAYAMALDEFSLEVLPSTEEQLRPVFQPYLRPLHEGADAEAAESTLVLTTLPQPFLLPTLRSMALAAPKGALWDRKEALQGLARLGTQPAWESIADVARGKASSDAQGAGGSRDDSLRSFAVLLMAEKADPAFLPTLLEIVPAASVELRGGVLRALGYFHDPRANKVLFDKLHSQSVSDRENAILGLRNLESREVVPALLAMLNDPEAQVRQVAHFALQSLTGIKLSMSRSASRAESRRVAEQWHDWWRKSGGTFTPVRQPTCRDW